jgi:hypothetical protein
VLVVSGYFKDLIKPDNILAISLDFSINPVETSSEIKFNLTAKYNIERVSLFHTKDIYKNLLKSGFVLLSKPSAIVLEIETEALFI